MAFDKHSFFFLCFLFLPFLQLTVSYQVSEMAVSELPGNPNAVWTVRRHVEGNFSIPSASLVDYIFKSVRSLRTDANRFGFML